VPLGGFAPLPLRLGGSPEEGVTAEQWNRLSLDVAAAADSTPLLVATVAGTVVLSALGRGGCATAQLTAVATSAIARTITLPLAYLDSESGLYRAQVVSYAVAHECGVGPAIATVTGNVVEVVTMSATSTVVVVVYGTAGKSWAGEYGADPGKFDSWTEGEMPYAWQWYQEIVGAMGSAYDNSETSYVTFERRAQARMFAYVQRLAELCAAQQLPGQSDTILGRWATIMGLPTGEPDWKVRLKAAARFALISGTRDEQLTVAIRQVMGASFAGFVRYPGTLDDPPFPTYWPEINPGPPELDISDGTWLTHRCHLVISLIDSPGFLVSERAGQITRDLADILDGALPATTTWNWGVGADVDTGFIAGVSRAGIDSL
jgi:hypothetical protein